MPASSCSRKPLQLNKYTPSPKMYLLRQWSPHTISSPPPSAWITGLYVLSKQYSVLAHVRTLFTLTGFPSAGVKISFPRLILLGKETLTEDFWTPEHGGSPRSALKRSFPCSDHHHKERGHHDDNLYWVPPPSPSPRPFCEWFHKDRPRDRTHLR